MKKSVYCLALFFCVMVTLPAAAQDALGRTLDRAIHTEELSRLEKDLDREKAVIDDFSLDQRERRAIAVVIIEPDDSGELQVGLKVRHGGEASLSMKGARFALSPSGEERKWALSSGTVARPKKWKALKIKVTPPGQPSRTVVCEGTRKLQDGEPLAFCIIPLVTNGDLYCPPPDRLAESAQEESSQTEGP